MGAHREVTKCMEFSTLSTQYGGRHLSSHSAHKFHCQTRARSPDMQNSSIHALCAETAIARGHDCMGPYLDLKKTFEMVRHKHILAAMRTY
eukprot:3595496-Amphidinium_carterae.1